MAVRWISVKYRERLNQGVWADEKTCFGRGRFLRLTDDISDSIGNFRILKTESIA